MRTFIKGTKVDFEQVFYDEDGQVAIPAEAKLVVYYNDDSPGGLLGGGYYGNHKGRGDGTDPRFAVPYVKEVIPMNFVEVSPTQGYFTASWNTKGRRGLVHWAVVSSDPQLTVDEGKFRIRANPATRNAIEDAGYAG